MRGQAIALVAGLTLCGCAPAKTIRNRAAVTNPVGTPDCAEEPPAIVIGFVGGVVRHTNRTQKEVSLADRLREAHPTGVVVVMYESYHEGRARKLIRRELDSNHDSDLSEEEKRKARVIIYGRSWGATSALTLARELEKDGIPVELTVQVDSVAKIGQNDAVIPKNVAEAVNFYQESGRLRGRKEIHAADPARTKILGNFRFDYRDKPYDCQGYPWYDRVFAKAHTQIECDPVVWQEVENLIEQRLGNEKQGGN